MALWRMNVRVLSTGRVSPYWVPEAPLPGPRVPFCPNAGWWVDGCSAYSRPQWIRWCRTGSWSKVAELDPLYAGEELELPDELASTSARATEVALRSGSSTDADARMGEVRSTVGAARANGALRVRPGADVVRHRPDSSGERPGRRPEVGACPELAAAAAARRGFAGEPPSAAAIPIVAVAAATSVAATMLAPLPTCQMRNALSNPCASSARPAFGRSGSGPCRNPRSGRAHRFGCQPSRARPTCWTRRSCWRDLPRQ